MFWGPRGGGGTHYKFKKITKEKNSLLGVLDGERKTDYFRKKN